MNIEQIMYCSSRTSNQSHEVFNPNRNTGSNRTLSHKPLPSENQVLNMMNFRSTKRVKGRIK